MKSKMYIVISDEINAKPSPSFPTKFLAQLLADRMTEITHKKYKVVEVLPIQSTKAIKLISVKGDSNDNQKNRQE